MSTFFLINSGCAQKTVDWHYSGETSLNSPSPISAYVEVTQQKLDGSNSQFVTCERPLCPTYQKKVLEHGVDKGGKVAVIVSN